MTTFLSLAISDTMFTDGECRRETITPADVQAALDAGAQRALNPSHITTIDLIKRKFGLSLPVPDKAPKIALRPGDTLIVVQANLPRLAEGQVHSDETVAHASIRFSRWTVQDHILNDVLASHAGISCTTGQLVPADDMPDAQSSEIIALTQREAAAINAVLFSQQGSPHTNPSSIDLDPAKWSIAERYGVARPGVFVIF